MTVYSTTREKTNLIPASWTFWKTFMSKPPENLPPLPSMTKRNKHIIRDLSPAVNHNRKNQIKLLTFIISSVPIKSEKLEKKKFKNLNNIIQKVTVRRPTGDNHRAIPFVYMFTFQSTVTVFAGAYAYFTVNFNQITKNLKRKKEKKKSPFVYSKKIKEQTSQNNSLNVVSARGLLKLVLQSGNNWTNNNKSKSINQSNSRIQNQNTS